MLDLSFFFSLKKGLLVTDTFDFACSLLVIKACSFSLEDEQALRRRMDDVMMIAFVIFVMVDSPLYHLDFAHSFSFV